ncbi:DUF4307 domain-containing protein [Micromonospora polyrhachis]|uniref:DUF4307 domain-containing protein n=1 Tax=Micromonospora polyrhachis TaxID=1282883 RepID=A0A7W7SNG7_9ACTN|nr:DUF4307 domain-containing protein [Micromonospora polyrhachis]MBB4958014.1 hypothetical protein [Micromonospora polyrhachis]
MSETHATSVPTFPPGRYGRRRATRRGRPWLVGLLAVGLLAAMALMSVRLYQQYGDPAYDAEVITYTDVTDTQILVKFQVTVPADSSAVCVLRARSRDGAEVAREEVRVTATAGEEHLVVQHRLVTTGRAFLGEVLRCRAAD